MNLAEAYPWASWVIAAVCAALVGWQYRDKLAALAKPILAIVKRAPSVVLPTVQPGVPTKLEAMAAADVVARYGISIGSKAIAEAVRMMAGDLVCGQCQLEKATVVDAPPFHYQEPSE